MWMPTPAQIARDYVTASNRCDYEAMSALFHLDAEWIPMSPSNLAEATTRSASAISPKSGR